jgi:Mor family transcriptional regulator
MYLNAENVLPRSLLQEIQKYVQGKEIYIPKQPAKRLGWGEANGTRLKLTKRNMEIYKQYRNGESIESLMGNYHMSYDSIKRIIHEIRKKQF